MTNVKLELLEKELEPIIKQLILSLRAEKNVDSELMTLLHSKLDYYVELAQNQKLIYRSFIGKMFYLFSTMVLEAKYVNYDKRIMDQVFLLRSKLLIVFDESNFKN